MESDYDCLEYSVLVQKFDFIIASRYHALVHAIKKNVPGIALGWAVKYTELFANFGLSEYVFDIRSSIDKKQIINAIKELCQSFSEKSKLIESKIKEIQMSNCFDKVEAGIS